MKKQIEIPIWVWAVIVILAVLLFYSWTETNKAKENYKDCISDLNISNSIPDPFDNYDYAQKEVYNHLKKQGYEVNGFNYYDGEVVGQKDVEVVMFDAVGSDTIQMRDGFWALYLNYDYIDDAVEMYRVQIIKQDQTCFYYVGAHVYTNYIMDENYTLSMYDLFDEGYCVD